MRKAPYLFRSSTLAILAFAVAFGAHPIQAQQNSAGIPAANCPKNCVLAKAPSSAMSPFGKARSSGISGVGKRPFAQAHASGVLAARWPGLGEMFTKLAHLGNGDCAMVEQAISQVIQAGAAQYGNGEMDNITSAVIQEAEQAGISPYEIGVGLARAAAALSATNKAAADAIARTVANQGAPCEVLGFSSLAAPAAAKVAEAKPVPTIETPPAPVPPIPIPWTPIHPTGSGPAGGCLTPSCTCM